MGGKPYPVSLRVLSFEKMFSMRDHGYNQPAGNTYAQTLRNTFSGMRQTASTARVPDIDSTNALFPADADEAEPVDVMANIEQQAIDALRADTRLMGKIESSEGAAWGAVKAFFLDHLPAHLDDRDRFAYLIVKKAMDHIYGPQDQYWETFKNPHGKTYLRRR